MEQSRNDFTEFMADLVQDTASIFRYSYCQEDLMADWQRMERNRNNSSYTHHKRELVTHLNCCGMECTTQLSDQALLELVRTVPCRQQLMGMLFQQLHQIYRTFPTSADHMQRLVRRLGDSDLQNGSVRLAIVKQFLRHTLYGTKAVQRLAKKLYQLTDEESNHAETVIARLDEEIFSILDKKLSDDDQEKYRLLIAANDLSQGHFRAQGGTRTDLYMFAFAFDMQVWVPYQGDAYDPQRDLEKNLFSDYYQYNLISHLTEGQGRRSEEPTGEGMNPKSYAEVIYIYYLRQNLPRATRLKKANQMIQKFAEMGNDSPEVRAKTANLMTEYYWDQMPRSIWDMSEQQLLDYLQAHYYIPQDAHAKARITIGGESRAAFDLYTDMLLRINAFVETGVMPAPQLSEETNQIFQTAGLAQDEDFRKLLSKMDRMLSLHIPAPEHALAKRMEDSHLSQKAKWLLSVSVCLRQLHDLTAGAVPKENPTYLAYEAARSQRDAGMVECKSLTKAMYDLYKCCNGLTQHNTAELAKYEALAVDSFRRQALTLFQNRQTQLDFFALKGHINRFALVLSQALSQAAATPAKLQPLQETAAQILAELEQETPEQAALYTLCRQGMDNAQQRVQAYQENLAQIQPWLAMLTHLLQQPDLPITEDPQIAATFQRMLRDSQAAVNKLHRISRTTIIALAYYCYWVDGDRNGCSMPQLLERFRDFVDPMLDQCRFQRLQEKNLFDMFTVFRLYHACCLDSE